MISGRFNRSPLIYLNDGTGHFTPQEDLLPPLTGSTSSEKFGTGAMTIVFATSDLDGEDLPEIPIAGAPSVPLS